MSADLLKRLIEAGTPAELIAEVAMEFGRSAAAVKQLEDRRAKDRARQDRRRELMPDDWYEIRAAVFERDGYACTYCGSSEELHCDHVVPLSRGGGNSLENLTTACRSCNCSKGAKTPDEWLQ